MVMRADFDGASMKAIRGGVLEVERVPAWILVPSSAPRSQEMSSSLVKP